MLDYSYATFHDNTSFQQYPCIAPTERYSLQQHHHKHTSICCHAAGSQLTNDITTTAEHTDHACALQKHIILADEESAAARAEATAARADAAMARADAASMHKVHSACIRAWRTEVSANIADAHALLVAHAQISLCESLLETSCQA